MSDHQKFLIVMRHGEQHNSAIALTSKGEDQVHLTGQVLKENDLIPDMIIPSHPDRTMRTGAILSDLFNVVNSQERDFLNTYKHVFDPMTVLASIPQDKRCVLLAAHEETIQCFGHYFLDDADTALLFQMLSESRYSQHKLEGGRDTLFSQAGHADALILSANAESFDKAQWSLYAWLEDGKIEHARDYKDISPLVFSGRKVEALPDFPEIIYQLHTADI